MGYVFQNQNGVMTVRDEATINKPKQIRFITPDYKEKFRIPDGEQILVTYSDGERKAFTCKYMDDYHLLVGTRALHICEYAEMLERAHAKIEPFPEKHIVWSDIDLNLEDWRRDLIDSYPELKGDEDALYEKMCETNADYLNDERTNLNMTVGDGIIAIADVGRWNGRFSGYKEIKSGNLKDCLCSESDNSEWFVDRNGEFRSTHIHHDGRNYVYYRAWKDGIDEYDKNELLGSIYEGKATQEDIDRLTDKLGAAVGAVYGWSFPTEKEKVKEKTDKGAR